MSPQWSSATRWSPDIELHGRSDHSWFVAYRFGALELGSVMWFGSSEPAQAEHFYPHVIDRRFGSYGDFEAAKRAVENNCLRIVGGTP